MWERYYESRPAPGEHSRVPIPVRRFERPMVSDLDPSNPQPPRPRSRTMKFIRSFHKPFYLDQPTFVSATPSTRSLSSPSVQSSQESSPFTTTRTRAISNTSHNTADTSVASSPPSPSEGSSGNWHQHHKNELDMCVVSPEDWFARFYSDDDIATTSTDECPDRATLAAVQNIPLFDEAGNSRTFGSFYEPDSTTHQRQLLIFVRHFYCGACQAYLETLTKNLTLQDYFAIPIPTSIYVIGCGRPSMIPNYRQVTKCPFPIFADPTRQLFKKLGMTTTLNIGLQRPEYMKDESFYDMLGHQVAKISQSYQRKPDGLKTFDIVKGGNIFQVGGEFLFEEGQVVWCHRMTNWRGHAEVGVLRRLLELDL